MTSAEIERGQATEKGRLRRVKTERAAKVRFPKTLSNLFRISEEKERKKKRHELGLRRTSKKLKSGGTWGGKLMKNFGGRRHAHHGGNGTSRGRFTTEEKEAGKNM